MPQAMNAGLERTVNPSHDPAPVKVRLYYLDWLRIIAYGILILYHAALVFAGWNYYVQNSTFSDLFKIPMQFVNAWRMPLLFMVSGIGIWFALGKRNSKEFLKERFWRLCVPLFFGVLTLVPPIFYFQKLGTASFDVSYIQFYSEYFTPSRFTKWSHLWFIAYLFVYVLFAMPFFSYMRTSKGKNTVQRVAVFFAKKRLSLLLLVIPLFLIEWLLSGFWSGKRNLYNDGYHVAFYFTVFLYGYFIAATHLLWETLEKDRRIYLIMGSICFILLYSGWYLEGAVDKERPHSNNIFLDLVWCLNVFSWMMSALGYARRYMNFHSPLLKYSNRATLPCYLLHHPVLVAIAFYTVKLDIGIFEKYTIVVTGTLIVTLLLYEFFIRRIRILHVFFGIAKQ